MIINSLNITPSKVNDVYYLNPLNYINGQKLSEIKKNGIIIDNPSLIPSLENGVFSVESIKFNLAIELDKNNEKIFYKTAKLKTKTYTDGVETLLEDLDLTINADTDAAQQVLEFVNYKQELFKINDTDKDKDVYIIFQLVVDNSIAQEVFFKFNYRLSNNIGDVNGDGVIDLRDLVALSDHVSNIKTALKPEFADVNGDGVVDLFDVVELSRRIING